MVTKLKTFFFLILFVTGSHVFGQQTPETAEKIVEKMTATYGAARTYRDAGSVSLVKDVNTYRGKQWEEVLLVQDFAKTKNVSFKSYFHRPGRVRFEWINNQSKVRRYSVVWSDGKNAYSWRTDYEDNDDVFIWDRESGLKWAIEEETRGSMSVFDILYNGLTGSSEYYSFNKMTQARLAREETLDGRPCYVIVGYINRDPWALWIDKGTFLLRRYRLQIATGSFDESVRTGYMPTTLGEVHYDYAQTNVRIPPKTFTFRPVIRKGDIDISKYKDEKVIAPAPLPRKP